MNDVIIVVLNLTLSLVAFVFIAKWYVTPWLNSVPLDAALKPILVLHSFRHLGMMFLVPGVVSPQLTASFAYPAAYGDLVASMLAFIALIALRFRWGAAIPIVWIFNLEGSIDLLYAISQGVIHEVGGLLGAAYWIPALLVPPLLVTHYLVFQLLWKSRQITKIKYV